jgi:hypothetical protein
LELSETAYYFGMKPDEFYKSTLANVIKFIENRSKKINDEQKMNAQFYGQICATIANFSQGKKRKRFKSEDFFKTNKENKTNKQNIEEQTNYLLMLTMALEGKVEGW